MRTTKYHDHVAALQMDRNYGGTCDCTSCREAFGTLNERRTNRHFEKAQSAKEAARG